MSNIYEQSFIYLEGGKMKKTYKLENLGCANCAQRMETAISKIEGVKSACINFFTCKLKIESTTEDMDEILTSAQREISKIERGCKIVI